MAGPAASALVVGHHGSGPNERFNTPPGVPRMSGRRCSGERGFPAGGSGCGRARVDLRLDPRLGEEIAGCNRNLERCRVASFVRRARGADRSCRARAARARCGERRPRRGRPRGRTRARDRVPRHRLGCGLRPPQPGVPRAGARLLSLGSGRLRGGGRSGVALECRPGGGAATRTARHRGRADSRRRRRLRAPWGRVNPGNETPGRRGRGAAAAHVGDDGAPQARPTHPCEPVRIRGCRSLVAGAHAAGSLPDRDAALPHPWSRRLGPRAARGRLDSRLHTWIRPRALRRLARRIPADLVHGRPHDAHGGARPSATAGRSRPRHPPPPRALVLGGAARAGCLRCRGALRLPGDRGLRDDRGVASDGSEPAPSTGAKARLRRAPRRNRDRRPG